jgi:ABC-2 type transport system ATP-binding protein
MQRTTTSGAAIEVRGLRKSYGPREILHGLDLTVRAGEVFSLLGPNGAGKTTTVEILEGHRRRGAGEVSVLGHDPELGERALRERIGVVLQQCGLHQTLTVGETVEMYARAYPRRRPVGELLELVGLEAQRRVVVGALSGGQRRRLDLALALAGRPELLFLDEPTTGFDPAARREAWAMIRGLRETGTTVFLTTHFMDEAEALADRVAILRDGRLVAEDTPDRLRAGERATEIRFGLPEGWSAVDLPELAAANVTGDGAGRVVVRVDDGVAAAHLLTGWALERGLALDGFRVQPPSLEDVYLDLTEQHEVPA